MNLCTQFKKKVTVKSLAITGFFISAIIATAAIITAAFLLSANINYRAKLSQLEDELDEVKNSVSYFTESCQFSYKKLEEIVDSAVSMGTNELESSVDTLRETLQQTQNRLSDTTTGLTNLEDTLERTQTSLGDTTTDLIILEETLEDAHISLTNVTIKHQILKDIVTEHIISATNIHGQLFNKLYNSARGFSSQWVIVHVLLIVVIIIM